MNLFNLRKLFHILQSVHCGFEITDFALSFSSLYYLHNQFYHSNESFHRIALYYTLEIICFSSSNNLTTARKYIVDEQDQVWVLRHVCAPSYKKFYLGKGIARATKSMSELSDMSMHLRPSCPKFHAPSVRLIHRFKSITQPAVNIAETCIQ